MTRLFIEQPLASPGSAKHIQVFVVLLINNYLSLAICCFSGKSVQSRVNKKTRCKISFLPKKTSLQLFFQKLLMISAFKSREFKSVVCLYCVVSCHMLFVSLFCLFHHACLLFFYIGNQTILFTKDIV